MSEDKTKEQLDKENLELAKENLNDSNKPEDKPKGSTDAKITNYEFGDLAIKCGVCGHEQIIDKNVKGGITIVLPTTKEHKLQLICEKCKKSDMSIYFLDAANPPIEEAEVVADSNVKPEDVKLTIVKDEPSDESAKESK